MMQTRAEELRALSERVRGERPFTAGMKALLTSLAEQPSRGRPLTADLRTRGERNSFRALNKRGLVFAAIDGWHLTDAGRKAAALISQEETANERA
jgi:hypothetical protein